jgi:predicted dehydrogenase
MSKDKRLINRREFVATTAKTIAATSTLSLFSAQSAVGASVNSAKKRVALVGTGARGVTMWGRNLLRTQRERVEMVGLCDINPKRLEAGKKIIGTEAPTFTNLDQMLKETRPDALIVTTRDSTHHEQIVRALKFGCDVITEKPMTIDEAKCKMILDAEKQTGKKITVAFNYRFSPRAQKIKELLMSNAIGPITSVDFSWYLDVRHGADYFRRWHAYKEGGGTLFVHKATHHFDLINWYLEADPVEVRALGELRNYGRNGKFRSRNCRGCPHKDQCKFYLDITKDQMLISLYANCESEDGYLRDACVYRENINIYDTMVAQVKYNNGVMMNYSLDAFMPFEGHSMAFNGMDGRLEVRSFERQPWTTERREEIRLTKSFGKTEIIEVEQNLEGGHGGADPRLLNMTFDPQMPDPYKQRAGSREGAMSILTGIAAVRSVEGGGKPVRITDLIKI